jgi:hypothetical protein
MAPELPESVKDYVITGHAAFEMGRRGLSEQVIRRVLVAPEQRLGIRSGRVVLQPRVALGAPERQCSCGSSWALIGTLPRS